MKRLSLASLVIVVAVFSACTESGLDGQGFENQLPQVWLAAAPPEGSLGKYTVRLFWGGWDPDGEVKHYEYLVTDNKTGVFDPRDLERGVWRTVIGNDSTFVFSADSLLTPGTTKLISEFVRSHTFFIRAVDMENARSEYAYRSFTSRTLSPEVLISVPLRNAFNPADIPQTATFRWTARDYVDDLNNVQDPESVQYAFLSTDSFAGDFQKTLDFLRSPASTHAYVKKKKVWEPWVSYKAPGDSGKFWTVKNQAFGNYMLAVRAKDEAGAITPVLDEDFNARRVRVSTRLTGPVFTLSSLYMGSVVTSSCNTAPTIIDIPAGVAIDFRITASAAHYGGIAAAYRYGWDISDLDDPEKWEVDLTPFSSTDELKRATAKVPARRFFFGTHVFTAEVRDNSDYCSRIEIKVNVIQFTLERNLLIVDDFAADDDPLQTGWGNPFGRGVLPTDAEHDQFWRDMVVNLEGFDKDLDMIQTNLEAFVPLTKIATYKSIIWSTYSDVDTRELAKLPELYSYIVHRLSSGGSTGGGKATPNLIALTMAAGGHVLIAGQQPVQNVIPRGPVGKRFPLIFIYEVEGLQTGTPNIDNPKGGESFAYKELCLETMDFGYTTNSRIRNRQDSYCRVLPGARWPAGSQRDDTMREALPIDPNFPKLTLRPEAAGTGKWYEPTVRGVDAEVYNPRYFSLLCQYVPKTPRACFQPIYGLGCFDTTEPTYNQPVAFFTSAFADRVADVPGAVGARSAVFGFPPVLFKPSEVRPAIEYILFNEWKLPRKPANTASN